MKKSPRVRILAVVGGSGAGKSWLVARLGQFLGHQACQVQLDDFYRDRSHLPAGRRQRINFDHPRAIDWVRLEKFLLRCLQGRQTLMPHYDFQTHRVTPRAGWRLRPIVIMEGLWLLRRRRLRRYFDLKLFLDAPTGLRCSRRVRRDVAERGFTAASVKQQLAEHVLPEHTRYVEPQKQWADLVLTQPYKKTELTTLANRLWNLRGRQRGPATEAPLPFRKRLTTLLSQPKLGQRQ